MIGPPKEKTVDEELSRRGVTVDVVDSDVPRFLATVGKTGYDRYLVKLRPGFTEDERKWVLFHEKGHVYFGHVGKPWYDRDALRALAAAVKPTTDDLAATVDRVLNACADCEVHTKLLGADYGNMEKALARFVRGSSEYFWPVPEAYGFEPGRSAAEYLERFASEWARVSPVFLERYPRLSRRRSPSGRAVSPRPT